MKAEKLSDQRNCPLGNGTAEWGIGLITRSRFDQPGKPRKSLTWY
jgi:hypothetical protein